MKVARKAPRRVPRKVKVPRGNELFQSYLTILHLGASGNKVTPSGKIRKHRKSRRAMVKASRRANRGINGRTQRSGKHRT